MMTQKNFIDTVFLNEFSDIVKNHGYISFVLMASGIEFLGGLIDTAVPFDKEGETRKRFETAMLNLFPKKYHEFIGKDKSIDLYKNLRGKMNHLILPGEKIAVSHRGAGSVHLSIRNGKLILVADDLYDDFAHACEKVKKMVDDGLISEQIILSF